MFSSKVLLLTPFLLNQIAAPQQAGPTVKGVPVHLTVAAGTPLRLYLTHRAWYRMNETVEAKFAEPVWAFDRIVIPADTVAQGQVTALDAVPGMERARAVAGGDFTPLKRAQISFTKLVLPDGRAMQLDTQSSVGLVTIYIPPRARKAPKSQKAVQQRSNRVQAFLKVQAQKQLQSKSYGVFDFVRGPNKREWVENFLLSKLPYHPQWYRSGTRFDAVLKQRLDFADINVSSEDLSAVGTQPPPDSIAQMRILSDISSADAHVGDIMNAVLSEPVFSTDHKLVLPEGTRLGGKITLTRPARMLRRGGQLRFAIENVQVPSLPALQEAAAPNAESEAVQAQLTAVEADPKALKVDQEGTAKATQSKTRFVRPAIAALVATKSLDNDTGKQTASGTGSPNIPGRSLGGFSGFGLVGIAVAHGPRNLGPALGFYGLAWSVYSNVISRGSEIKFEKNTAMAIRFGAPPRKR